VSDTDDDTSDDDYEPPLDEGDEYDSAGANPDSETDSIAGDDERNFDSDEEDFGVGGGVGDVPGLRAAGDLGDPGVAETPTAPVSAPLLLPPPPPRAPPPRERAEGGARGPAGLGIPETMGVSGRAPRNVRSVYASSNAPDANTVRREGETDAVVPAPAGGTSEPSGDRRRGDGAITKRRRVGTENAIDDPEPTLGCARCRHSQKGCARCKAKHAKWAARNGAAGDGIEPERAPSGADDDRDEERESQHGDADAAHDAVDVAVAVADAAVADAGVSRAVPAQLPDRPRMYGKGAYALLPMLRNSLLLERAKQLLVVERRNVQSVAEEIDVRKLFADVPGVDVEGRGFSKNVNNALRILAQEYGIALAVGTDAYDPAAEVPPPPPPRPGPGGGGGALRARARGDGGAVDGAPRQLREGVRAKQHATWHAGDDVENLAPMAAGKFAGEQPGCVRSAASRRQTPVLEPVDYFQMFVTDEMLDEVATESTRYWHEVLSKPKPDYPPEDRQWPPAWAARRKEGRTLADLKKFIGVLLGLAAGKRNRFPIRDMLSRDPSAWASRLEWLRRVGVTESWFLGWTMNLHCQPDTWVNEHGGGGRRVRNRAHPGEGAAAVTNGYGRDGGPAGSGVAGIVGDDSVPHNHRTPKMGRFIEKLHQNCMKNYKLQRDLSLDEQTATSDSRSNPLRHLQPHKPSNGVRIYSVCDLTGYCWTFMVDLREKPAMTIESVVFELCSRLPRVFHRVYMDNLFTSVVVLLRLREWNILAAGTARSTGGFPRELNPKYSPAAAFDKTRQRGEWMWMRAEEGLLAVVWCDVGIVKFMSNFHGADATTVRRRMPGHKLRLVIPAPVVGGDYNGHMGGVDKADQLRGYQTTQRKSAKWWHTLFYWCLDITLVNAYVCYKSDFGRALAEGLVEKKDMLNRRQFTTSVAQAFMCVEDPRQIMGEDAVGSVTRRNTLSTSRRRGNRRCPKPMPSKMAFKDKTRCALCYERDKSTHWATTKCSTCGAFLCLMPGRNCFIPWHTHGDVEVQQLDEARVNLDASGRYESGSAMATA
jgi:hypothetical protein